MSGSSLNPDLSVYIHVPKFGTLTDQQKIPFSDSLQTVQKRIWSLGGEHGWLIMNWAWKVRGLIDKIVGGTGLRRGRRHPTQLKSGDALDFWRVLLADEQKGRLLLYAEMKLPGEAWLEFQLIPRPNGGLLVQTATFRPNGLWGRFYWYALFPFHVFIFRGLAKRIAQPTNNSFT